MPPRRKPGDDRDDTCPPCFNCNLPQFECTQFSVCNSFTGYCDCRAGFGGPDCSEPVCGALSDDSNKRPLREKASCDCKSGWGGINCNVCQVDSVCNAFMPDGVAGSCYKEGVIVNNSQQMCEVTNKKIIAILNGKKPQVTFSCNKTAETCNFQFWVAERESFYCDLSSCDFSYDLRKNSSLSTCKTAACKCLPGRMLCGEDGSIDISDFLTETIAGPADFSCDISDKNCRFSEPSMNDLITNVFGDPYITLHCDSGECLHYSQLPGYKLPEKSKLDTRAKVVILGVTFAVLSVIVMSVQQIRKSPLFAVVESSSSSYADESNTLLEGHIPATLTFEDVGYAIKGRQILKLAFGVAKPRECLAIMGGSGAGKTTLIDILAAKNKSGRVGGTIKVNGQTVDPKSYKKLIGFVDQEDYLIPTLTVYETVLNSALLRLPRVMSLYAKNARVLEILTELRILHIRDRLIGDDSQRGISGGEKRRVAIACELVTSPSILFLDEPTSGLDSYNAKKVVESLVRLSRDYDRTIIFTIHQPRSNIVAMFDKLLLLAEGKIVYSGEMSLAPRFFAGYGFKCPLGYNIADYLIDVTTTQSQKQTLLVSGIDEENINYEDIHDVRDSILGVRDSVSGDTTREWQHYASHRDDFGLELHQDVTPAVAAAAGIPPAEYYDINTIYVESPFAAEVKLEIALIAANPVPLQFRLESQHASFVQQLAILCSRTFKNLYRNPKLLLAHYVLAITMGVFIGTLYYDVSMDISGFQNRLGMFFFILALFGFSTLTGLHSFSVERAVFIRERSNNYYHPLAYYIAKIICDVLPLRIIPPMLLLIIAYPLAGLNMEANALPKALLIIVMFNLSCAMEILIIGILVKDPGSSTMVGVLTLLFSLLFAGLFVNKSSIPVWIYWLQWGSVFHFGYEALTVNEVAGLVLREKKYGLSIEVPGATILSTFGFSVGHVNQDIAWLGGWALVFIFVGYFALHVYVIERR
ncbi:hypothetical protein BABINDRAFT_38664 [Babjeviella inositovora NRRL Y-12698]|uniref:ABC transporter domain-containing protein n=1 Tax=Babjeviella inositovora NRRL Y-12698 TaxID=984486 RepID=A0A1E3QLY8_9ASCO|nr:uncharacterized protein BABINDRAFT_38664 [Babjeviella inositovora NRRL Y-12698]ODQ78705.1 hypothetical protein BABINDRAFT_38664 [Babjeviella inositovora NRRL Y-12698]